MVVEQILRMRDRINDLHKAIDGGCLALERLAATLVKTLEPIGSEPAAAEVRNLWSKARDD